MRTVSICSFTLVLLFAGATAGVDGEINKALRIGDAAPAWENLEGIDGNKHSLKDLKKKRCR